MWQSEQDIFGGSAPKPATPEKPTPEKPPGGEPATPSSPDTPTAPAGANQPPSSTPPAAAADETGGTDRDRSVLNASGETQHLSDYQAPENPLQIGGQIYLRAQSTAFQNDYPDKWTLTTPALVDAYFDARPNPRVRAFILGRMSYNATAAPSDSSQPTVNCVRRS